MKARRERWHDELADVPVDGRVFVDESAAATDMQRLRGRSPRGERCVASGPAGRWAVATMIGAVRLDGPLNCETLDGAVDGAAFLARVSEALCPLLRPGDVVAFWTRRCSATAPPADHKWVVTRPARACRTFSFD